MPAGDATLPLIFQAMADWEQTELVNASVEGASAFKSFAYFPTKQDVDEGLTYPFTAHGCDVTAFEQVTPTNVPSMMVFNTHTVWTALMFGVDSDPLASISQRDAEWREAYFEAFVKHLQLQTGGTALVSKVTILSAKGTGFDLFNKALVGVRFDIKAISRRTLVTGL